MICGLGFGGNLVPELATIGAWMIGVPWDGLGGKGNARSARLNTKSGRRVDL